jgi:predicted ATPase
MILSESPQLFGIMLSATTIDDVRLVVMVDQAALNELERRIQIVEDNLRQLVEQAAAYSGAADEARNADRIAEQQEKLDALLKQRDELLGKG